MVEEARQGRLETTPRVCLHLHPGWPSGDVTVLEAVARDGVYRSQFETGTSNGGLTAHPGGDRWRWESRLFGGRYDEGPASARPLYGALDDGSPHGPAPRFGSGFLRLRPEVTLRSTFCYPDSVFEPEAVVGPEGIDRVLALMRADAPADPLDRYVEAHVHGGVRVDRDVEAVVLDPCHRGTPVEDAARRLGCALEWHPGFRLETATMDPAYRGQRFVDLARQLGDVLTPADLADAVRAGHDPVAVKRIWHHLAHAALSTPPGG